ncbi:MAG: precorrin-6y C5,15-methyltransferase (decarboxylating) subunit CbiE, partial [Arachnia sp.]
MISVFGLLGAPSDDVRAAAGAADWVMGGNRHLDALDVPAHKRIVLGALRQAVEVVQTLSPSEQVVVIASGDPLYYGVVRSLRAAGLRPRVVPGVGAIPTAFARVGLPWDDAVVVSVHGRPLAPALALARSHPKVAVFTSADNGIRELATGLAGRDRTFVLAERLGEPDERVQVLDSSAAATVEPLEPNVVLILAAPPDELEDTPVAAAPGRNEPVVGQVTSGAASLTHAERIDEILGVATRRYPDGAVTGLPQAWAECDLIVSHLALGATTRLLAPLLASKKSDPGVVVLDEAGHFAVPLVGGHGGGANDLARRIAAGLGATAVVTTATDAVGLPALDTLGWPWTGDVAGVT